LAALEEFGQHCDLKHLDEPWKGDPFGSLTFHFKTAIADAERAYLGSANFNTAGLASRWELGVLLTGVHARRIASLVEAVIQAPSPTIPR